MMVVVLLIVGSLTVFGQSGPYAKFAVNHSRITKSYEWDLRSELPSVVESAAFNLIIYKERYPEVDFSGLVQALRKIERSSDDSALAYKAHLVAMYLRYGSDLHLVWPEEITDHEFIYRQIAEHIENKFLVSDLH
jgi:hypothetical protein